MQTFPTAYSNNLSMERDVHFIHSWAPLTKNLAGEKRDSLIANSNLAQLYGKTLKTKSAKLHVC